jgi:hypothetical protein
MKLIENPIQGRMRITENTQINNLNADTIEVAGNITIRLYGNINHLLMEPGSKVYLHGNVTGVVKNNGGELVVYPDGGFTAHEPGQQREGTYN